MNWNFDRLNLMAKMSLAQFSIEGGTASWVKKFAHEHNIAVSHAARELISAAVKYWQKNRQSLERETKYPFAEADQRGEIAKEICVMLDAEILKGLREIALLQSKSVSRVVSEILLDARNAHAEVTRTRAIVETAMNTAISQSLEGQQPGRKRAAYANYKRSPGKNEIAAA